jgi:hypothetical protein
MASKTYITTKSRRMRITRLDTCGAPVEGDASTLVTNGLVKVETALDIEDGDTFEKRDAWGDYCLNDEDSPRIKGADLTIEWCAVDPDGYELTTGARLLVAVAADSDFAAVGDSVGFGIGVDTVPGDFALEVWTKIGGGACTTSGDPIWLYTVWPWVTNGRESDGVLERGVATYEQTARAKAGAAAWGAGPYTAALPMPAPSAVVAGEVIVRRQTPVQPPAVSDGAVALAIP